VSRILTIFLQRRIALVCVSATLCVVMASSSVCFAQRNSPPKEVTPTPSIEQILDHYGAALGGREAWEKLTTRVMKATMSLSGAEPQELSVVVYQQAPDKFLNVTSSPSGSKTEIGFNGEVGWMKDSKHGCGD
jgi:hypothetical protein